MTYLANSHVLRSWPGIWLILTPQAVNTTYLPWACKLYVPTAHPPPPCGNILVTLSAFSDFAKIRMQALILTGMAKLSIN
jgi:hypothetical protein